MVDVLCDMKERALKETNPHIMTIATLTGHAVLANGPYTNVMDNGPAKRESFAQSLQVLYNLQTASDLRKHFSACLQTNLVIQLAGLILS